MIVLSRRTAKGVHRARRLSCLEGIRYGQDIGVEVAPLVLVLLQARSSSLVDYMRIFVVVF